MCEGRTGGPCLRQLEEHGPLVLWENHKGVVDVDTQTRVSVSDVVSTLLC